MIDMKKQIIADFRQSKYKLNPDGSHDVSMKEAFEDLTNAVEQLATGLYEKDIHFVMELIQNAEDNQYIKGVKPQLDFLLLDNDPTNTPDSDGCLCVFNNELGFTEENIKSISAIGKSTKSKVDGFIGEKGIGFKSVYIVTSSPHIFSNGYQIKFYEKDPDFFLNYIVPYWVSEVPAVVDQRDVTTSLLLPLKKDKKQKIIKHLDDIQPESILFLNKLEGLSICVEQDNKEITFQRLTQQNKTCKLDVVSDGEKKSSRYWIYKETVVVPADLEEEKRQGITEREIVIAFPLDKSGLKGEVFSYLPTEADSGFPFLINTDFMLTANRESIQTERDWNIWLRDVLPDVIVNALLDMQKEARFKKKVYEYIPVPKKATPGYFSNISESVCEKLKQLEFVYSDRNALLPAIGTRLVTSKIRELFDFEKRPDWFASCSFVDCSINKYSDELNAIGVSAFTSSDLMECLDDTSWLKKRKQTWFLQLYNYFHNNKKGSKSDLSYRKIIPCDKNKLFSPNENVYWVAKQEVLDSLNKILSLDNFPEVKLVRPGLFMKLQTKPLLMIWAKSHLGISELSLSSYIETTLLPWMDENTNLLDSKKVMSVTAFILEQWESISKEAKDSVGELLPVVLEDGAVYSKSTLEGLELLVPRGFDPETGWQIILKEPEEYDHSDVLNKDYLKFQKQYNNSFKELMIKIKAFEYPDFKTCEFFSYEVENIKLRCYLVSIFCSVDATRGQKLTTWQTPAFFYNQNKIKVLKNRKALIHWLEAMITSRTNEISFGRFDWYYRTNKSKWVESLLMHDLRTVPWINTTKGLMEPGEVFVESKSLKEIFQNKLPYLKDTISPKLCDFLSIKTEVTTKSILDYLGELSNKKKIDKGLILKLYKYLNNHGIDLKEAFEENKYIFVPESKNSWYSIDEVIWENAEEAFGDSYAWLSNHYPKLKDFFIDKLEVKENVDDQSILNTWLTLQEEVSVSEEQVEAYLSFAIPKIISMIKDNEYDDILEIFFEEALLWVQTHKWINIRDSEAVYIPDDIKLRNLFKDQDIYFPWRAQSATHPQQSLLYGKFNLPKLSESVSYKVIDSDSYSFKSKKTILTDYSVQLICEMIVNEDKFAEGWFEQHIETGLVSALFHADEKNGSKLDVEVSLNNLNKTLPEVSAFFDKEHAILFISSEADFEDVKDDVAESIAREIWKSGHKSYVDTIRNLLAVTSDKRYKKIRDSKGWNFGKKYRDKLKEISDTPLSLEEPEALDDSSSESIIDTTKELIEDKSPSSYEDGNPENRDNSPSNDQESGTKKTYSGSTTTGGSSFNRRKRSQNTSRRQHRSRISRAKSGTINRKTNTVRRNRMVSYVVNKLNETRKNGDNKEKARARKEQGDITEKIVFDDLSGKGYEVKRMPEGNAGYDLEVINPESGELYYIEVKSVAFQWSELGVGISVSQYEFAREKGDSFILAIVDNLANVHSDPIYIINPVALITEYRFDHMWSKVSTNLKTIETEYIENVVQELMSLTDSERCKELINHCDKNNYPLPDVGIEISNDDGEVIFEDIELGWEQEKIAIVLGEIDKSILLDSDWDFYSEDDEEIESILEEVFRGDD